MGNAKDEKNNDRYKTEKKRITDERELSYKAFLTTNKVFFEGQPSKDVSKLVPNAHGAVTTRSNRCHSLSGINMGP